MEIQIEEVLKNLREIVGVQAQEIAVLKATVEALQTPSPTE